MSMFEDVAPSFVNRSKATSSRLQPGGIYVGIVTRLVTPNKVYVKVPKLGGINEYGPCVIVGAIPSIDDFVLVGFLDNKMSELVSFGTFSKHPPTMEYLNGVLDEKAPINNPSFTGTVSLPSATSIGNVSSTEIGYVDGVTSSIQTQINAKADKYWTIVDNPNTSLTLDLTHVSDVVECSSSSATTVTIPAETTVNFPVGTEINISWIGSASYVRVARASTSVTANGSTSTSSYFYLRAQWSMVTLLKRASNSWHVFGDFYVA